MFGAYLLSVYDPETETYQTISKLGTGFSEEVGLHLVSRGSGEGYGEGLCGSGEGYVDAVTHLNVYCLTSPLPTCLPAPSADPPPVPPSEAPPPGHAAAS